MTSIEIINEVPLTMAEVKDKLKELKSKEKELPVRLNKTMDYLNQFVKKDSKKAEEIKKRLESLDISRLRDRHIVKIIDVMPKDIESLKAIFSGENVTLKQEDLKKILDGVNGN